jgi:hypothetical protein
MSPRASPILDGLRGAAPVGLRSPTETIIRISALAANHADQIIEFDVNPLIWLEDRAVAVGVPTSAAGYQAPEACCGAPCLVGVTASVYLDISSN